MINPSPRDEFVAAFNSTYHLRAKGMDIVIAQGERDPSLKQQDASVPQAKPAIQTNLNWNLLRTFMVIAQEQSITRAAQRLSLRQPSVTYALQRLEETLRVQLVDRSSRNFALTKNGEAVFDACTDIFHSVSQMTEALVADEDATTGLLRLMTVSHVPSSLIDESIRLLHQRHPAVTWQLDVANSGDIVREIAQERAPLGICLLMKPVVGLDCRPLFREEFSLFCGSEHPLFGCESIELSELQQQPFVSFACARDGIGFEPMTMLREGVGLGSRIVGFSGNLEEVRRLIVAGIGIGVLPRAAVEQDIVDGKLYPLPILDGQIGADVYLVTNPNVSLRPVERKYIEIIEELQALSPLL